jgi:spore coat protein A, manganese oxidase
MLQNSSNVGRGSNLSPGPPARGRAAATAWAQLEWKKTGHMHPGAVTTVIVRFDLPSVPVSVPASARTGGHEYVWHYHILEHEAHDMMRPRMIR